MGGYNVLGFFSANQDSAAKTSLVALPSTHPNLKVPSIT